MEPYVFKAIAMLFHKAFLFLKKQMSMVLLIFLMLIMWIISDSTSRRRGADGSDAR